MMPGAISEGIERYLSALESTAPDQVEAVYAVGSIALEDFSVRQSNVDLVVVSEPALGEPQRRTLAAPQQAMRRAGRDAEVWFTTWEEVAGGPAVAATSEGSVTGPASLATPMTWAILRRDPMALTGPDWPVVWQDDDTLRAWCVERLQAIVADRHGLLVLRRAVVPVVLEAARLAETARSGRVLSKSEAGEAVEKFVRTHFRRILTDAVGYRRGAQTSMYWGPFERKYDALAILPELLEAATTP